MADGAWRICLEICPAGAARIENNFGTGKQDLVDRASSFLTHHESAKAIVFACNWSFYPDLQASLLSEDQTQQKEYKILVNMCGGRLEKHMLMAPFLHGAWGVMAACCTDGDCQHDGNLRAKKTFESLKNTLATIDISPERANLVQISPGDKAGFQEEIDANWDPPGQGA